MTGDEGPRNECQTSFLTSSMAHSAYNERHLGIAVNPIEVSIIELNRSCEAKSSSQPISVVRDDS